MTVRRGPARHHRAAAIRLAALALLAGVALEACGQSRTATPAPQEPPAAAAAATARPPIRLYPQVPAQPAAVARLLQEVETQLREPSTAEADLPDLGHQQQVIYRVLSRQPAAARQVLALLSPPWRSVAERHLKARQAFLAMGHGRRPADTAPAWRIIPPAPAEQLLAHYRKAAKATGIAWEVLAAVNLVETGMGRIDGVSVANAQGPMQFLPSTWAEAGIGQGNIRDPHDSIQAAARYLVRRGGLRDIRQGLWGYNNSRHYGEAVLIYASLLQDDPRAFKGLYHWEIHYQSSAGDLWLPVGYSEPQRRPVQTYLQQHPRSRPPQGSDGIGFPSKARQKTTS